MAQRLIHVSLTPLTALVLALSIMMMSASGSSAQSMEGSVRLTPAITDLPAAHQVFTVWVELEDLRHFGTVPYDDDQDETPDRSEPSNGMGAFEFTLEYDPGIVTFESIEEGPELGRSGRSFQCLPPDRTETGVVSFGCVSFGPRPDGPQGSLTLGTVTLRRVGSGTSALLLEAQLSGPLGDPVPVSVKGGVARLGKSPGDTVPSGEDAPAPPTGVRTPVDGAEVAGPSAGGEAAGPNGGDAETRSPARPPDPSATRVASAASGEASATPVVETRRSDAQEQSAGAEGEPDELARVGGGGGDGSTVLWAALGIGLTMAAGAVALGGVFWRRRGA